MPAARGVGGACPVCLFIVSVVSQVVVCKLILYAEVRQTKFTHRHFVIWVGSEERYAYVCVSIFIPAL